MAKKQYTNVKKRGISWIIVGSTICVIVVISGLCSFFLKQHNVLGDTTVAASSSVKELFVPFGTGMNTSTDWVDVKGVAASVDSRLYGTTKRIVFEATVSVPAGNQTASVRLYNATDKHPVWYSDLTLSDAGPVLLISSPITLDWGNKLYQVQMKSQLGGVTNLLQARMHIILQ